MTTAYDDLLAAVQQHNRRDAVFEEGCRVLALAFRQALVDLGFPKESLRWVEWDDRHLDAKAKAFDEVRQVLQEEGCDAVTLQVRAADFFMWPVLKLRFEDGRYTLLVIERTFTGAELNQVALDAAANFVTYLRQMPTPCPPRGYVNAIQNRWPGRRDDLDSSLG